MRFGFFLISAVRIAQQLQGSCVASHMSYVHGGAEPVHGLTMELM